ncbi:hypothetical protein [Microbacterium sp.]|uniref:hypothetical protein n=1 Tax=Microbacterium sp. TaxID=51671 RepID=UPI00356687A7
MARGYLPSRWDAVRRAEPHDVLFYVSGVTLSAEDGRARNWLVDDFAEATTDAVVVQHRPLPSPVGPPLFSPTLSMEAATARSRWRARGKSFAPEYVSSMNTLLGEFARHLGKSPGAFQPIVQGVLRNERLRPFQMQELSRMLERVAPKVAFYDNGSYTYNGEQLGLMKDAGIHVVEPQHGWIGPSHPAYNFGRVFSRPELARAVPDELLTFGSFWSDSIRHPGVTTAIGKPHLERQAAASRSRTAKQVLVVSSRTDIASTDAFVVDLRAALGSEWSVVFRPHPGERAEARERYPRLSRDSGVAIDDHEDVYESLKSASVVVGEASTVLFEARAFGCQVIARESAFAENVIGDAFGARVGGVEETVSRLLAGPDASGDREDTDPTIWAPGAIDSYTRWSEERLRERDGA